MRLLLPRAVSAKDRQQATPVKTSCHSWSNKMELASTAPVLVTGASSFVAGHLINQLLQRGYKVRGTVRSKENSVYDHLLKLPNAEKNLEIVEADLTKQSTWEAAFSGGVEYVFHVASPHILKPEDPENTLMLPAVGGTQNILEMCQRTESVKKLIFTSCMCAVSDDFDNNREYDESDWNTMSSLTRNSYAYSKALAEMGVINFTSRPDCRFKVATILPCIVLGPNLCNKLSFSHKFLLSFLNKQIRGRRCFLSESAHICFVCNILFCFLVHSYLGYELQHHGRAVSAPPILLKIAFQLYVLTAHLNFVPISVVVQRRSVGSDRGDGEPRCGGAALLLQRGGALVYGVTDHS